MNTLYLVVLVGLGLCVFGLVIADLIDVFGKSKKQKDSRPGKYIVCDNSEESRVVCDTREEAKQMAQALNTAFKLGAESVLHNLSAFSLDQRRKFGIVWGEKSNSINS